MINLPKDNKVNLRVIPQFDSGMGLNIMPMLTMQKLGHLLVSLYLPKNATDR